MPAPGSRPAQSRADRASSSPQEQAESASPSPDSRDSSSETESAPPQAGASSMQAAGGTPPPVQTGGDATPSLPPGAIAADLSPPDMSVSACYSVADSSSPERARCSRQRAEREQQATLREQRAASAIVLPTPTDRELRSAAPVGSGSSAVEQRAAAEPVETPDDLEDPLMEGIGLAMSQLPATADMLEMDMPAASVASHTSLATTIPSSEVASTSEVPSEVDGGDDRDARAFRASCASAPS